MGYNKNTPSLLVLSHSKVDPVHLNDQLDVVIFFFCFLLTYSSKFVQILKRRTRSPKFIFT